MDTNLEIEMQTNFRDSTVMSQIASDIDVAQADAMPCGVKNPLWVGLPTRLLNVRLAADLTMVALGELSGVSNPVIANTENRRTIPRIDSVERLACALGISPTWFAFGYDGEERFLERIRRSPLQIPKDPRPGAPQPCPESYKGMPARIQAARQKAGLSLRGLADASGLSGPGVKKIETGASVPTIDNVEAIAKALGVSPGWLAFGIGRGPDGKKTKARAVA